MLELISILCFIWFLGCFVVGVRYLINMSSFSHPGFSHLFVSLFWPVVILLFVLKDSLKYITARLDEAVKFQIIIMKD